MPETKIVLKNVGVVNPKDINSYIQHDGFKALEKALAMTQAAIIDELKASGLRGRGGAGFPTGMKWEMTLKAPGDVKYLICNADEGEVGAFKDRYLLENDPFTLVEAMAITCHAIGAKKAYLYVREEYHFVLDQLKDAVSQADKKGFLKGINIEVYEGAGAYVCGEESALMDSIEGKRGEVRYKPPFPPVRGLFGKPTVIDNVETLMNVPQIILNGSKWYAGFGTEKSKGTKALSVSGDVKRPGVYEMVLGSTMRELVEGLAGAENVKFIQVGGATGRIVPASSLDTPLTFETLLSAGPITVFNQSRDVIDVVYRTVEFLAEESCGKCTPCRQGTETFVQIMERFDKGQGKESDILDLQSLSTTMILCSLCGLGQAAPNPVVDTLQHFRSAYEERIAKVKVG